MKEEIKNKAYKLGQIYFPDKYNVWARENIEAKFVSSACIEMAEWMQKTMVEKACQWILNNTHKYIKAKRLGIFVNNTGMASDFRKAMLEEE